jgi:hypothetical protein
MISLLLTAVTEKPLWDPGRKIWTEYEKKGVTSLHQGDMFEPLRVPWVLGKQSSGLKLF